MKILINNEMVDFNDDLFVNDGKISFTVGSKIKINEKAKYIVPGFIDQHIHGAGTADTMDNNEEAIEIFAKTLPKEGTTSFLATTMTYDLGIVKEVISKLKNHERKNDEARIVGVHMEGPFISPNYIGAQNPVYQQDPNAQVFELINSEDMIKVVTYAPELDDNFELTKYLSARNIVASVGHSGASCDVVNEAIKYGLNNFTHFHNASSGHHHREPGVVTSGLMNRDAKVELIVDGIHVNKDTVKAVYNIKGYENIILITDSMRAKGAADGEYDLGGQTVYKKGMEARLKSGVLAGSVLEMNMAIKNMVEFTGCNVKEAFMMASYNVAKHLNLDTKGLIKEGYDFDVTVLDENFNVLQTFVAGEEAYTNEEGA